MSGITGDFEALDAAIAWLEGLTGSELAKAAAPRLEAVARGQWAAGQAPDGSPWPRTRDGAIPLVDLTSQIVVSVEGSTVRFSGPDLLRPHFGKRPVWPSPGEELPAPWRTAVEGVLRERLERR